MFKFNFSTDKTSNVEGENEDTDTNSRTDLEWEDAKELDLSNNLCSDYNLESSSLRVFLFKNIKINIIKREAALLSIENDSRSPKATLEAEMINSDLLPAKYEGGLKVWECSEDLGNFIADESADIKFDKKKVLDLGCGAGLVGLLALGLGAEHVTFQDYNQEVLTHWTFPNSLINFERKGEVNDKCKFWCGDWDSFASKCDETFDIIFTSETVYNPDNYEKLKRVFNKCMKNDSVVYLAAKSVYFSLGGSVQQFLFHINKEKQEFVSKEVFKSDEGVQRVIIEIRKLIA